MAEGQDFWPFNIGDGWVASRRPSSKVIAKIEKAAYIAAEIATGTWDFGEDSVPRHKDHSRRVPMSYVMERSGWSPKSSECRRYMKSSYFVRRFEHEMDMRSTGLTKELAKLGDELTLDPETNVLKQIGMTALKTIHDRIMDEHQVIRFSNRDLLSLAQFGLNMGAKVKAAQGARDERTPTFNIQTDVMNVIPVDDPRMLALRQAVSEETDRTEG